MSKKKLVVGKLVDTVVSIRPILSAINGVPRLILNDWSRSQITIFEKVFNRVLKEMDCSLEVSFLENAPDDITSFELSARNYIKKELGDLIEPVDLESITDTEILQASKKNFVNQLTYFQVKSHDDLSLNVYSAGDSENEMLVIIPPCGMPKELYSNWIKSLSSNYFLVTWDARGLFNAEECKSPINSSLNDQVLDLISVMNNFDKSAKAHLLGLCGGVVIALNAASIYADRVYSLSLWHGDLDFGGVTQKTSHQKNTQSLMKMGGAKYADAEMMHQQLMSKPSVLKSLPASVAHLVIYPYTTVDMFYNYCRMNGVLMETNSHEFLDQITAPVLVVSSSQDDIAHPDGSRHLGNELSNVTFIEEAEGQHIEVFNAPQKLIVHQLEFLEKLNKNK